MGSDNIKGINLIIAFRSYFNDNSDRHIDADFIEVICSLYLFISKRGMAGVGDE